MNNTIFWIDDASSETYVNNPGLIEPLVMKMLFHCLKKIYHAYLMKNVLHVNPFLESSRVLWAAAMHSHYSTLKQQMTCSAYPLHAAAHIRD